MPFSNICRAVREGKSDGEQGQSDCWEKVTAEGYFSSSYEQAF